jgi:hypothetical protein
MLMMQVPKTMKVGESAVCRINGEPATVTWRDTKTLVIEPGDARLIIHSRIDRDMRVFFCGDAGVNDGYRIEEHPGGVIVSAPLE